MRKQIIHIFFLIICFVGFFSQNSFSQKNIVKANMYYNSQLYSQAIDYFVKEVALNDKATKKDAMIKLAFCYKQTGQFIEAENVYRELMKQFGKKEPIYIYEYANALRSSSKYAEAVQSFEQYKKVKPNDPMTDQCIQSCVLAEQWLVEDPEYYVRVIPEFNTEASEISPVLIGDTLVFSSSREGSVKKVVDVKEGGKSTMLDLYYVPLNKYPLEVKNNGYFKGLNTFMHEGPATFSADGNTVYFTRTVKGKKDKKETPVTLQIYYARREASGDWSEAKSALQFNSNKYSVAHPSLSPDGKKLFFASDIPGGKGGTDIYYCELNKQGQWGTPINLGSKVNTIGNELTPFILNDTTLYFSSDFHPGMGKKDIFMATYSNKEWGNVENLKPPINTLANDFGYVRFPNSNKGFLTSDRFNGIGREDIYSFINNEPNTLTYNVPNFLIKDNSFYNQSSYDLDLGENKEKLQIVSDHINFEFVINDTSQVVLNERREGLPYNKVSITKRLNESNYFELLVRAQQMPINWNGYVNDFKVKDTLVQDTIPKKDTIYFPVKNVKVTLTLKGKVVEEVVSDNNGYYAFTTQFQPRKQYEIKAEKLNLNYFVYKGYVKNEAKENIPNAQVFLYQNNKNLDKLLAKDGEFQFKVKKGEIYRIVARAENYEMYYIDVKSSDSLTAKTYHDLILKTKGSVVVKPTVEAPKPIVDTAKVVAPVIAKPIIFYTVLLYSSTAKKPINDVKNEYGIKDSITVYFDANLYKYTIGKYDSLADATIFNNTKMQQYGGKVKYVVDGKFYDIEKTPGKRLVEGKIVDEAAKPVQAKIEFNDNETNKLVAKTESDKNTGEYSATLTEGKNYGMFVTKDGYIFHSENINLTDDSTSKTKKDTKIQKNIAMKPAVPGNSIVMNNIFFDYGKSTIRDASIPELDRVTTFLKDNPKIRVEISGHTCNTSSWAFNKKLSDQRARTVANYLINHGISKSRIVAIGYSYDKPIASNATEEGKQKNRRTEFKIIP